MKAATHEAYKLLHQGSLVLSHIEANGMRVDTEYLDLAIAKTEKRITRLRAELKEDKVYSIWQKRFGRKTNFGSREQLGTVLFGEMGLEGGELTSGSTAKKARYKVDEKILAEIDLPFVKNYLRLAKFEKLKSTYLEGLKREVVDGYAHPVFNAHLVRTYRLSGDSPNFQNLPVRDEEMAGLIRRCFIASEGHVVVEIDFKGIEVSVAACRTKDPMLIKYTSDPSADMHRDSAVGLYMLDEAEVLANPKHYKDARYCAKNMFVFPEFYGSYYPQCAKPLWEVIGKKKFTTVDGTGFKEHLASKGVKSLGACDPQYPPKKGTFERHVKDFEDDFWNRRFKVYRDWKKATWEKYKSRGYVETLTGFILQGVYEKNQILNGDISGSASHCELWLLIQLDRWLVKNNMKSKIVGTIHDSTIMDVHQSELRDVYTKIMRIVTHDLPKHWDWIIVPMRVEIEEAPLGGSWFDKRPIVLDDLGFK